MFPSINSDNPFDSLFKRPYFLNDQNPSFKQDDHDPPFFFNFPSPIFDEHDLPLNQILSQNHLMAAGNHSILDQPDQNNNNIMDSKLNEKNSDHQPRNPNNEIIAPLRRRNLGPIPRRRTGKKDRHSKICTAQGIRDRRMRLSLQVARKFFDLQDMLGYDKASKTIEWLFTKSKKAIKELVKDHPQANYNISISSDSKSESFVSECEVVSGIEENSRNENLTPLRVIKDEVKSLNHALKPNTRESRDKARARARSRTREKMMMIKGCDYPDRFFKSNPNDFDLEKLGFSSNIPFEGVDQISNSQNRVSSYGAICQPVHEDVGTIEKLLGNSSSSSSWPRSDYQSSDIFLGFLANWDLLNNDKVNAENQVSLAGNPNSVYSATPNFP